MDKNETSIKTMIITTIIGGIIIFVSVFAVAFGMIEVNEVAVRDKGVDVNDLTQKELTAAILEMDLSNKKIKLFDIENNKILSDDYEFNSATKFLDADDKLMASSQFKPGNVIDIMYTESSGIVAQAKINPKSWEKKDVITYDIDYANSKIIFNDKTYTMSDEVVMYYKNNPVNYMELEENVVLAIRGYDETVLALEIQEYLGSVRLIYTSDLDNSTVSIDSDKIIGIEDVEDVYLRAGEHIFAITKKGIDEIDLTVMIEEGKVTEIEVMDVSYKQCRLTLKSNVENYYMTVKSSDGTVNKTYTDDFSDTTSAEKMLTPIVTLPFGTYVFTFSKDGCKTITRQITLSSSAKTLNVSFVTSTGGAIASSTDKVKLVVETIPQDALIYVNGEYKGTGKVTVRVPKGDNVIKVTKSGYQEVERTLTLDEDKEYTFTLTAANVYETPSTVTSDIYNRN